MSKPKQYWIDDETSMQCGHPDGSTEGYIHVIEYSAYEAMMKQNKIMREALEKIAPEPPGCDSAWYAKQALRDHYAGINLVTGEKISPDETAKGDE